VSHNPLLLAEDILRRDQIWFTEKYRDGATSLYPLTDFSPRKQESVLSGYVSGRYGALPVIPEGLGF
jgi:AAA15 family ATPase/GTPase